MNSLQNCLYIIYLPLSSICVVGKYSDEVSAREIGERIRVARRAKGYSLEDVSSMTGFSVNTLSSIENGGDTYVSMILAICQSLQYKPSELFEFPLELKPRYELPPDRRNRALTTLRINQLYDKGFFSTPRLAGTVAEEFAEIYGVKPDSSEISTALKKLAKEGKLEYTKSGRKNLYVKRSG